MSSDAFHSVVAQLDHVALATGDVECLCDFYQQLGAVVLPPSADPGTGFRTCVLDFWGVRLELFERPGRRESAVGDAVVPALMHLGFALGSADAVDELSRVVATAGHRVLERPHRAGQLGRYESIVLDPDGNRVKLTV